MEDRKIAEHCGVLNRMVSYIHAELLGGAALGKISQEKSKPRPKKDELQRVLHECDSYKAQLEA